MPTELSSRSADYVPVTSTGQRSATAGYLAAVFAGALLCVPLVCAATWLAVSNRLVDTPELQIYLSAAC